MEGGLPGEVRTYPGLVALISLVTPTAFTPTHHLAARAQGEREPHRLVTLTSRQWRQRSVDNILLAGYSGGGSDLLKLLFDSSKVTQGLPPTDCGGLLVERARPHSPLTSPPWKVFYSQTVMSSLSTVTTIARTCVVLIRSVLVGIFL